MKLDLLDQPHKKLTTFRTDIKRKNTHLFKTVNLMNQPPNFQRVTFLPQSALFAKDGSIKLSLKFGGNIIWYPTKSKQLTFLK